MGTPKGPDLWSHCKDEMINPFEKSVPGPVAVGVIVGQFLTNAKSIIAQTLSKSSSSWSRDTVVIHHEISSLFFSYVYNFLD